MDYKLAVVSVANPPFAEAAKTKACQRVLEHHGYDHRLYVDHLWHGWSSKLTYIMRMAHELTDYTHLMFLDAADVIVLASAAEAMERYFYLGHPWVFNAEPFIWSPDSFKDSDYPPGGLPYKYLNSGACIGEREHMVKYFDQWTDGGKNIPLLPRGDQDWFAGHYLKDHPDAIKLDTGCLVFQTLCGSRVGDDPNVILTPGKAYNIAKGTYPLVVHFNGGDDVTEPRNRVLWEAYFD